MSTTLLEELMRKAEAAADEADGLMLTEYSYALCIALAEHLLKAVREADLNAAYCGAVVAQIINAEIARLRDGR